MLISVTYALFGMIAILIPNDELRAHLRAEAGLYARCAFCILAFYSTACLVLELGASLIIKVLNKIDQVKTNNGKKLKGG